MIRVIEVGEEGVESMSVFLLLLKQLLAIKHIAGLDGQHVGGDDRVERPMGHRGVVGRRHGSVPGLHSLSQLFQPSPQ